MRIFLVLLLGLFFQSDTRFLPWKADVPLRWEDFQGDVPEGAAMSAKTFSKFSFTWNCDGEGHFSYAVEVKFDRELSWAKDGGGSAGLLAHEQLHFDIAELVGRRFRKALAGLPSPCTVGQEGMSAMSKKYREELAAMQSQYDKETNHSEIKEKQASWEAQVRKELDALSRFAIQ